MDSPAVGLFLIIFIMSPGFASNSFIAESVFNTFGSSLEVTWYFSSSCAFSLSLIFKCFGVSICLSTLNFCFFILCFVTLPNKAMLILFLLNDIIGILLSKWAGRDFHNKLFRTRDHLIKSFTILVILIQVLYCPIAGQLPGWATGPLA